MNQQVSRILSKLKPTKEEDRLEEIIRKSYPLFCASAKDGVVLMALNATTMPSRVDMILDRIAYGGVGNDTDIGVVACQVAGIPAIWRAEVDAGPQDISAEHLARDAKEFITTILRGTLISDPMEAMLVFAELGFTQQEDRIVVVDVLGNQQNKSGWTILPEALSKLPGPWFGKFVYNPNLSMRQVQKKFLLLGERWRALRMKTNEEMVWETVFLRRDMAQKKQFYQVFERQEPHVLTGGAT